MTSRHPSSLAFHRILRSLGELHDIKSKDYGAEHDPFANVRASEGFGVPAWVGCMIRANDKMKRLQALAQKGELANEAAEDSFRDLAVYSIIGLVLFQEGQAHATATDGPNTFEEAFGSKPGAWYGCNGAARPATIAELNAIAARSSSAGYADDGAYQSAHAARAAGESAAVVDGQPLPDEDSQVAGGGALEDGETYVLTPLARSMLGLLRPKPEGY